MMTEDTFIFCMCYPQFPSIFYQPSTKCYNEHIIIPQLKKKFPVRKVPRNTAATSQQKPVMSCGQTPTLLYLPMARAVRSHSRLHRCSSNRLLSVRFSPVRFTNWWAYTTWPVERKQVKFLKACFHDNELQVRRVCPLCNH